MFDSFNVTLLHRYIDTLHLDKLF